jgi:hypothetical protein
MDQIYQRNDIMADRLSKFRTRLEKIGIDVTFAANYPWIYFDTINGKEVTGTFHANHGWTAFFLHLDGSYHFSDRREVFKKVRELI